MATLSLERDIYPAFSSGELDKICGALKTLMEAVCRSTHDADSIFRSFNWSWPMLTAKARSNTPQGILVIEGFTCFLTSLLLKCSTPLVASIAGSRNVIRIIMRDLGSMNSLVVIQFLKAIAQNVLTVKDVRSVRGYLLEKSAVEHLINLSSSTNDDDLAAVADSVIQKILVNRKLFTIDFIVDFSVKLIKSKSGNAESATMVKAILESHRSVILYDSLMQKLIFLNGDSTVLKKLRVLHFLNVLATAESPGTVFSITKVELTSSIIGPNKLVSLFALKLFGSILARLNNKHEKIVEISALLPLLLSLTSGPGTSSNILLLAALSRVLLTYKRVCPAAFFECKFNWLKLLVPTADKAVVTLAFRLLFGIYSTATPLTHHMGALLVRAIEIGEEREELASFCDNLVDFFFVENFKIDVSSIRKRRRLIIETFFDMLINSPGSLSEGETVLSSVLEKLEIVKTGKKIQKIHTETAEELIPAKRQKLDPVEQYVLPRVSYKKRYLCPPFPEVDVDPYNPVLAGWATICLANDFGDQETDEVSVNVIDLVGQRVDTFYACIMSLSHPAAVVRECAFEVLAIILRAIAVCIESAEGRYAFREAPQVAMVLTWFRNGILADMDVALPRIVTCYVVEIMKIMFQPQHVLYPVLFKLILKKPFVKTNDFIHWSNFFYSTDGATLLEHRMWALHIIQQAASDPASIDIMIRRGIVQGVMECAIHLNSHGDEFELSLNIVKIVLENCENKEVLVRKFGIVHWLRSCASSKLTW